MLKYISPNLFLINSDEKNKDAQDYQYQFFSNSEPISFEQLCNREEKFIFIYGNPGLGKTRLLQEVALKKYAQEKQVLFLELKKVKGQEIFHFVKEKIDGATSINNIKKEDLHEERFFKSEEFNFRNDDNTIIFLDALDEVGTGITNGVIDKVKEFINANDRIQVLLSCRRIQFNAKQHKLSFNSKVEVSIGKFYDSQVSEILVDNFPELSKEEIKDIQNKVKDNILQTPRYLKMFLELASSNGIEYLSNLKVTELYDRMIIRNLEIEQEKFDYVGNQNDIIKRGLAYVALTMEIQGIAKITRNEYHNICDKSASNFANELIKIPQDYLYNRHLIRLTGNDIDFTDRTFQSYLSARAILNETGNSIPRLERYINKLAIEPLTRTIKDNWFEVIGFLIIEEPKLTFSIINFIESRYFTTDQAMLNLIVSANANEFNNDERKSIFEFFLKILEEDSLQSLPFNTVRSLVNFYPTKFEEKINNVIASYEKYSPNLVSNYLKILIALNEKSLITEANLTQTTFKVKEMYECSFTSDNYDFFYLREILNTEELYDYLVNTPLFRNETHTRHYKQILEYLINKEPDDLRFLELYIELLEENSLSYNDLDNKFAHSDNIQIINRILLYLVKSPFSFHKFCGYDIEFDKSKVVNTLDNHWDENIAHLCEIVFEKGASEYLGLDEYFYKSLFQLLLKKSDDFIYYFLESRKEKFEEFTTYYASIFEPIFTKYYTLKHIQLIRTFDCDFNVPTHFLSELEDSENSNKDFLLSKVNQLFKKEIENDKSSIEKMRQNNIKRKNALIESKKKEVSELFNDNNVIELLKTHPAYCDSNNYEEYFTKEITDSLDEIILFIFEEILKINPVEHFLHPQNCIFWTSFNLCFNYLDKRNIKIENYENHLFFKKIVWQEPINKDYFTEIKSTEIVSKLISCEAYSYSYSDRVKYYIESLDFKINYKEIFREYIENVIEYKISNEGKSVFSAYINIHQKLYDSESYILSVFYKTESEKKQFIANILIEKYENKDAINFLLSQISSKAYKGKVLPTKRFEDAGSQDDTIIDSNLFHPFFTLKSNLSNEILDIFKEIIQLNVNNEYEVYLQNVVYSITNYWKKRIKNNLSINKEYIKRFEAIYQQYKQMLFQFSTEIQQFLYDYYNNQVDLDINESINLYNTLVKQNFKKLSTNEEFNDYIYQIIDGDFREQVEIAGILSGVQLQKGNQENIIQRMTHTELENLFLKDDLFSKEDIIKITREEETSGGKKIDFYLYQNLLAPIMIEVKRLNNPEVHNNVKRNAYYPKLHHYMAAKGCKYGFYLIFDDKSGTTRNLDKYVKTLQEELNKLNDYPIIVMGFDCELKLLK